MHYRCPSRFGSSVGGPPEQLAELLCLLESLHGRYPRVRGYAP